MRLPPHRTPARSRAQRRASYYLSLALQLTHERKVGRAQRERHPPAPANSVGAPGNSVDRKRNRPPIRPADEQAQRTLRRVAGRVGDGGRGGRERGVRAGGGGVKERRWELDANGRRRGGGVRVSGGWKRRWELDAVCLCMYRECVWGGEGGEGGGGGGRKSDRRLGAVGAGTSREIIAMGKITVGYVTTLLSFYV
ncbi:hypothetical protein T492DRAFT_850273 [Pavlovales sp. CCMP2436]|nr:hypothetical protein T492DRAFT_850273 [Pavlovales sp. CCMP2436]